VLNRRRILGAVLDRELRVEGLSDAEAREELSARMPGAYVDALFRFYVDGTLDESQVLPAVQEITGRAGASRPGCPSRRPQDFSRA
jgi:hypothetical protein